MKLLLRPLLLLLSLGTALPAWSDMGEPEGAEAVQIPQVTDLSEDAGQAGQRHLPIVLLFSAEHCSYCETLKRDFLKPAIYSGSYANRILFREVMLVPGKSVRDFDGSEINVYDLSDRYHVKVTPTLVFVDRNGREMAEKMVGLGTPDFYGTYLDEAIQTAYRQVRAQSSFACKDAAAAGNC